MIQYDAPTFDFNLDPAGLVIDLTSLYAAFARLTDQRDARGVRYVLPTLLTVVTLAKLAGENTLAGIAEWVLYRIEALSSALALKQKRAPVHTTEPCVGKSGGRQGTGMRGADLFANQPNAGQSVQVIVDGKELRGTIEAGHTHETRLMVAFLPAAGWVLFQVQVGRHENEISASLQLLKTLDLRGKIVSGDAILVQRELSRIGKDTTDLLCFRSLNLEKKLHQLAKFLQQVAIFAT